MSEKKTLSTSNIQKALKESKSKKSNPVAAEEGAEATTTETTEGEGTTETTTSTDESRRPRLTDEQRAEREAAKTKERAEKKAQRDKDREARRAVKEAEKAAKIPHMAKVDKQAKNLPSLTENAQTVVTDIVNDFDEAAITAIVAHLSHTLRVKATSRALTVELKEGQMVRIVSAEGSSSKWVGHLAQVLQAQRIRCYVQPVGTDKKVYLFSSNVEPLTDDEIEALESQDSDDELVSQSA